MEKETKTALVTVAVSFTAGVATTLTILALCCCPMKGKPRFHSFDRPAIERPVARMHGKDFRPHKGGAEMRKHRSFRPNPEMKERFAAKLGLTDEQKAQIEQFRLEDKAKMEPLFLQMDELKGKIDKLRAENKARFESVLTDEQKAKLKEIHKKHPRKGGKRKHKRFGGNRMIEDKPVDLIETEVKVETPFGETNPVTEDVK